MLRETRLYYESLWIFFAPILCSFMASIMSYVGGMDYYFSVVFPYMMLVLLMSIKETQLIFVLNFTLIKSLPTDKRKVSLNIILSFIIAIIATTLMVVTYMFVLKLLGNIKTVELYKTIYLLFLIHIPAVCCGLFIIIPHSLTVKELDKRRMVYWKNIFSFLIIIISCGLVVGLISGSWFKLIPLSLVATVLYLVAIKFGRKTYMELVKALEGPIGE